MGLQLSGIITALRALRDGDHDNGVLQMAGRDTVLTLAASKLDEFTKSQQDGRADGGNRRGQMSNFLQATTIDEAIEHAKERAERLGDCECAREHAQLAAWLEELSAYRRAQPNEPITLDELRGIGDTPVWLAGVGVADQWVQIQFVDSLVVGFKIFGDGESWSFRTYTYGNSTFLYRRAPEPE